MIKIDALTKRYGKLTALNALSMEVPAGEVLGFIGPNGAGKTTTIKILSTLLDPSGGRAEVGGFDVVKHPREVREILGYMPDFCGVYEDMRVLEYLHFFAAVYGLRGKKASHMVQDVLRLTDLTDKADAPAEGLSRGMQQRLGLARVLLHDPKVLLLDEPASGLDPRARIEIRMLLNELRNMGKTIIISSHILVELAEICNSIAIIEQGELLYHGGVAEALRKTRELAGGSIFVGVEEGTEKAQALLLQQPGILNVTLCGEVLEVETAPETGWSTVRLFDLLVKEGFRLTRLEDEEASLEDAFMHLTRGKVQ